MGIVSGENKRIFNEGVIVTVYLVGAGPGDPELITLKGINALKKADTIIYDNLANEELLKYGVNAKKFMWGKRQGNIIKNKKK